MIKFDLSNPSTVSGETIAKKGEGTMRFFLRSVIILLAAVFLSVLILSCGSSNGNGNIPIAGGPCTYTNDQGTATITSISTSTVGTGVVEASFVFTSTAPSFTAEGILYTESGLPSADVISLNGITVGETLPADYELEITGACTPGTYTFPTLTNLW